MKIGKHKYLTAFLFLLPSLTFLGIFTYYPIIDSFRLSFFRSNPFTPNPEFIGLQNYIEFFHNPTFWRVVLNNVIFTVATIIPTIFLALLLAILINEVVLKGPFRMAIFLPKVIPYAAAAMIWVFLYDPSLGPINRVLQAVGIPSIGWLGDRRYSLLAIIITMIWRNVGYYMLIYLAGLQSIPKDLYDAARTDGASWLSRHLHVTIPLMGPSTLFVFVVSIIQSFKAFTQIQLMTRGGPGYSSSILIYYTYEFAFKFWELGKASTLTSIMILSLLFLVLIVFGYYGRRVTYQAR
ncbi:MAG: carbohydrate ABC transporter permease [Candidatus Acetothermia bacterium]